MTVRCPQCASEQPETSAFCGACGGRLPRICPACRTPAASADQRFCSNCGTPLHLRPERPRERRLVSILFADLVGFTTFSETRDAEDVRDVLEQYFVAARRVVGAYGGTIEKFIGDAVMAVWGTPVAREDDAERAVRAGLQIAAAVGALAGRLALPDLQLRVGILTGEAAVNLSTVMEGMVVGDAVNTAARIQSIAPPGQVLVEDVTRLATERSIAYEPAGSHAVKGKRDEVRVWRAVGVVSLRGGAGRRGVVEPPLVGRDAELAGLKAAVDGLLQPDAGTRAVSIIGEAGLGKSRLAWELEKYADGLAAPIRWRSGRAAGFGEAVGLSPLAEMFRTTAGIGATDDAEAVRRRVSAWLEDLWPPDGSAERAGAVDAVHRLLDLDAAPDPIAPGTLFSAWRSVIEREARRAPLVLCFEELHRAEDGLLGFIEHLLDWGGPLPILVLLVARPDARIDPLALRGERIEVTPLGDADIDALVGSVVDAPPAALLRAIRFDGGGVPLFAVETLRALADGGVLAVEHGRYVVRGEVGDIAVPPTVHALVAARLDRLGPLERGALAAGAILGERFMARAAAALAVLEPADAAALLEGLAAKAILRSTDGGAPTADTRYEFLQGVVRRVLLSSLARRERRRLHLAAVEHLTSEPATPDLAARLANHLLAGASAIPDAPEAPELRRRARRALVEAAERAAAVGSLEEAIALLDQAAELTEEARERAAIFERAGEIARLAADGEAGAERYRRAGALHAAAGRERERLAARAHELRALRYVRAPGEILDELRRLDAALADRPDAASALAGAVLAYTLYQCERYDEAAAAAQRAVDTAATAGAVWEQTMALIALGNALSESDRPERALEVYRRALALAEGRDERQTASVAGNIAVVLAALGRFDEALTLGREGHAAARRAGDRFFLRWTRLVVSRCRCSLGDWDEAVLELEAMLDDLASMQIGMAVAPLVAIALARGELDRVRQLVALFDERCGDGASRYEPDFRMLRTVAVAILAGDEAPLQSLIPSAEPPDYAEWPAWLAPVVERLAAQAPDTALVAALGALRGPGRMRRTPPVQAQAARLEAHLAVRRRDVAAAGAAFDRARRLALGCGLVFEAAVIAVEWAESRADGPDPTAAMATFARLRAEPWLRRSSAAAARASA